MEKQKVIVYVDGFNFYHGLKAKAQIERKWKKFYWLDLVKFFTKMMLPHQELTEVIYFSARPLNQGASDRQNAFFLANKQNPKFKLVLGKYLRKNTVCRNCGSTIYSYEEKETDVRIATQIINDVYKDKCDVSIIVSADSDMIPSIELVREIKPDHRICVFFPPLRHSIDLTNNCDISKKLAHFEARFNQSILPNEIELPSGYIIKCPDTWK